MRRSKKILIPAACATVAVAVAAVILLSPGSPNPADTPGTAAAAEAMKPARADSVKPAAVKMTSFRVPGMNPVAENDFLVLLINKDTAEVAVGDKRTGKVWYSNPQDRDADKKAAPFERDALGSQLTLTFIDGSGNSKMMLSNNDSVKNKQFKAEPIEEGYRVTYTFGDMSKGIEALPKKISKERLEAFMAKIDEKAANYAIRRYLLSEDGKVYERFDDALKSPLMLQKVADAFAAAGYTEAELAKDNAENNVQSDAGNGKPNFTVPVEYTLDGGYLIVTVPTSQIKEPEKNPITQIELFKYFSAAGLQEKGYMLVPDGSGSLIYLNNGKSNHDIYSQSVYGADEAIRKRFKDQNEEGARLPVFGMKTGDSAYYAVIEKGAAIANINAEVSGKTNSYNYAYASFSIRKKDELPLGNGQTFNYVSRMQEKRVDSDLVVRYGFLPAEEADYAGMAEAYQNDLAAAYGWKQGTGNEDMPFYLDVVGNIAKRKAVLGIPYQGMEPLTTFQEAQTMVTQLNRDGITNIKLRYLGWFNDGVKHKVPTGVSVDGELGGSKGLKKLSSFLRDNGASLYPDVSFLRVYRDTWSFRPARDASRYITRAVVEKYPYDRAILRPAPWLGHYFVLSPSRLLSYVGGFLEDSKELDLTGLSLRDMGRELNPDYRPGRIYDRERTAGIVMSQIAAVSKPHPDLLVTGGNAYALPYAKHVVDAPLTDSGYYITDEAVPFYQMVIHGFIPYAGPSFNLADEQRTVWNMLKAVEYGSNIRFTWAYGKQEAVKETDFDDMYSIDYRTWYDEAKAAYEKMNGVLKHVQNKRMTGHEKLQEGVYATTYEDGTTVYVNYTGNPVTVNGVDVQAESFAIGGGQG